MKRKSENKTKVEIKNTGYSDGGAGRTSGILKAYNPIKSSAVSDVDANLPLLRNRASDLAINTPIGAAAINTSVQYTIGTGLRVYPRINASILGMSADDADEWNRHVALEFELWANSKSCDIRNRNTFYELQEILYRSHLVDGDSFAIFRRGIANDNPYTLKIQAIDGLLVSNPLDSGLYSNLGPEIINPNNGNKIVNGLEMDANGRVIAYWISNRVPYDPTSMNTQLKWTRVIAFGDNLNLPNVLHICHDERLEQCRGIPYLAPVVEAIKQITRYTTAELTSAIMKTYFTLFLTQTNGTSSLDDLLHSAYEQDSNAPCCDPSEFRLGHGTINALPMGVDVKSVDNSNSQSTFSSFTTELIRQVASALGQPFEVLMKSFNSSYSASRAALLQAWDQYKLRREAFARDLCQPIYEQWLMEAIAIGRVKAPMFYDDPIMRNAYLNSEWYGPAMSILDPVKDVSASLLKVQNGLSTYEKEAAQYGSDFKENMVQLLREQKLILELNKGGEKNEIGNQE